MTAVTLRPIAISRIPRRASTAARFSILRMIPISVARKVDAARSEIRRLAGAAIAGTRAYQRHVVVMTALLLFFKDFGLILRFIPHRYGTKVS